MKTIKISPNGTIQMLEIANSLDSLQAQVGGFIEFLNVDQHLAAIVNEEGKIHGLPYNSTATTFARKYCDITSYDNIVGEMLLVGSNDDGETVDVPKKAMGLVL